MLVTKTAVVLSLTARRQAVRLCDFCTFTEVWLRAHRQACIVMNCSVVAVRGSPYCKKLSGSSTRLRIGLSTADRVVSAPPTYNKRRNSYHKKRYQKINRYLVTVTLLSLANALKLMLLKLKCLPYIAMMLLLFSCAQAGSALKQAGRQTLLSSAGSARDDTAAKQRAVEGYCGKTSTDSPVKSDVEACKSFFQTELAPKSLAGCALRCLKCGGCRYATFSHKMRDCSLYEECDVGHLAQGHGYQTRDVQGLTESTLARAPPPPSPPPPPPPLPPREPGDWRDAACLEPAKGDQPVFAVFGGSNSAGTNSLKYVGGGNPIIYGRHISSFADELMRRLPAFRRSDKAMAGGMGPTATPEC